MGIHQWFQLSLRNEIMFSNCTILKNFEIPSKWIYRGEGNCNIVISLPDYQKILRIRKTEKPRSFIWWLIILISDFFYWYCGKGFKEENRDLKFYSIIMRPLIGNSYTSEAKQAILTKRQIKSLEKQLSSFRPEFRKYKTLQYDRAAIFDDFAFLPSYEHEHLPFKMSHNTFAVEIKPKQGFRPLSEKHFPQCFFCMNQYWKKENHQVNEITGYCPENLFSGDKDKMKGAIKFLIKFPQNNFKIFKNGELIFGEKTAINIDSVLQDIFEQYAGNNEELEDEFCDLIQKCLTRDLSDNTNECQEKLFCEWNKSLQKMNYNQLPQGCVLEKILSIQMLDCEGSQFYNRILSKLDNEVEEWSYIKKLFKQVVYSDRHCMKCTVMMLHNAEQAKDIDLMCAPYLLSAIAKDCSLMVTFKRIQETIGDNLEVKNIVKTPYGHFVINVGVFDLYPKPLSTIKKHEKRNKAIYEAYMRSKFK